MRDFIFRLIGPWGFSHGEITPSELGDQNRLIEIISGFYREPKLVFWTDHEKAEWGNSYEPDDKFIIGRWKTSSAKDKLIELIAYRR